MSPVPLTNFLVRMEDAYLTLGSVTLKMTAEMDLMKETRVMKRPVLTINSLVQEVVTVSLNHGFATETTIALIKETNKTVLQ